MAAYHGHIFKLTGDGFLAEFPSVIDAVECAAVVQNKLAEKNSAIEEDLRIDVRMGINIGEVIVEDDDRYGEGVNIAARLQELADPAASGFRPRWPAKSARSFRSSWNRSACTG